MVTKKKKKKLRKKVCLDDSAEIPLNELDLQASRPGFMYDSTTALGDSNLPHVKADGSKIGTMVFHKGQWREVDDQGRDITYKDVDDQALFQKIDELTTYDHEPDRR